MTGDEEGGLGVLLGPAVWTSCAGAGDGSLDDSVILAPAASAALDTGLCEESDVVSVVRLRGDVGVRLGTRAAAGIKDLGGSMPAKAWVITQFDHPG